MNGTRRYWVVLLVVLAVGGLGRQAALAADKTVAGAGYRPGAGSLGVAAIYDDWYDDSRQRPVPVKIYHPREAKGPWPVVIFSHGLGGSREGAGYLGEYWASHGYVTVHLQHEGSDSAVWGKSLNPMRGLKGAVNPENSIERVLDVKFCLDELTRLAAGDEFWRGRLDLNRIGAAGHSYGAFTTLALAGQLFRDRQGREISLADRRLKAVVIMSPPVPEDRAWRDKAFRAVAIPCLHLTGTRDRAVVTDTTPEERREPYDQISGADQYLLVLTGGDHMVFSGRRWLPWGRKGDRRFHRIIQESTQAFWDAYLKGEGAAKQWLAEGGLDAEMGEDGTLEVKLW